MTTNDMTDDMTEEMGMTGDARRCPRHPQVATSSADGMFDAPCGVCEAEMDTPAPMPTVHEALKAVSDHCDHARNRDNVGFSGLDANFANKMAALDTLSLKQEWYVARFCYKYRRQVIENFEARGRQITQGLKGKAKDAAIKAFVFGLRWVSQTEENMTKSAKPTKVISAAQGERSGDLKHFVVRFPYSPAAVETFKNAIDWRDRKFNKDDKKDPKWEVLAQPGTVRALRAFAAANGFTVTDGALAAMERVAPSKAAA